MDSQKIIALFMEIARKIESEKEYVTELDSILGDGDHWVNINKGYQEIVKMSDTLKEMEPSALFMKIGMSIMSVVGGSSGVLYGDAFIKAAQTLKGCDQLDLQNGYVFLETALSAMMNRGKAQPGDKTMIDPLAKVVAAYKEALEEGKSKQEIAVVISQAAEIGMNETRDMVARKGRATYREDKGVGHIDAGAATMYYQLDTLGKFLALQ